MVEHFWTQLCLTKCYIMRLFFCCFFLGQESPNLHNPILPYCMIVYSVSSIQGIMWPLQGLEAWIRYTAYCLPVAMPAKAVRDILLKGNQVVYIAHCNNAHDLISVKYHCSIKALFYTCCANPIGWGLGHQEVWLGLAIPTGWFLFFAIAATIGLHLKK